MSLQRDPKFEPCLLLKFQYSLSNEFISIYSGYYFGVFGILKKWTVISGWPLYVHVQTSHISFMNCSCSCSVKILIRRSNPDLCYIDIFPLSINEATYDIIQVFHTFLRGSQNYQPRDAVGHLMTYRPRPKAGGDSSPGGP